MSLRLITITAAIALATSAHAQLVIGGFDAARGGVAAISGGTGLNEVRASITTAFPGTTFTGAATLTPRYLATIDVLFIASGTGANSAITPLSAAEQSAVSAFVANGGAAIIASDNDTFAGAASDPANESVLDPFGIDCTGTGAPWSQPVTVIDPSASPLTDGPFGVVTSYPVGWTGWFNTVPATAEVIATVNQSGLPGLLLIPAGELGPSSGPVVVFSDSTLLVDTFYSKQDSTKILLLNAIALTSATPCEGDLDGNGTVDAADLAILLGAWNTSDDAADLDNDGNVTAADLAILLGAWGPC